MNAAGGLGQLVVATAMSASGWICTTANAQCDFGFVAGPGNAINGQVFDVLSLEEHSTSGTCLYAGGAFVQAGNAIVNRIARWDGSAWTAFTSDPIVLTVIEQCPGDVVTPPYGDGVINILDLLMVLNSWGPCNDCAADIYPDGQVNSSDLLWVTELWGPCP